MSFGRELYCYNQSMSWAVERRTFILVILGLVAAAVLAWVIIAILFKTPTCTDSVQNQDEQGIDCGGSCTYLCTELVRYNIPTVSFVRALTLSNGRTDVVASIVNKNRTAAVRSARYNVELYGAEQTLIATYSGTTDIPADSEIPLFIPNLFSGNQIVSQAFLTFDDTSLRWFEREREPVLLETGETVVLGTNTPRVTAIILNNDAVPVSSVKLIATVYDEFSNVIAASQTVISQISAFGQATAVFTWNQPFSTLPARIDVQKVPTLTP